MLLVIFLIFDLTKVISGIIFGKKATHFWALGV